MSDVTRILHAIDQGDPRAAAELLPLVYDDLRRLAAANLAHEKPGQTLNATALVHEAYLRLVGDQQFANRQHFFAAAAEAMRRILIDNARRKKAQKRAGARVQEDFDLLTVAAPEQPRDLLALDEALNKLAATEPDIAQMVKLRYFAGLTIPQVAESLGIAPRTADAWWAYARAWLLTELRSDSQ